MTRKVSYSFKTCDTCSKWVLKNKNCHETSSKAAIWTNRRTYTFEMDNEAPGRKSLAPMSFLFPITFFRQVRVQDSATGNIVTQYHPPHGRVVGVYTSSPTSSMLLRRVACHPAGRKTKPVKGKMSSWEPTASMHQALWSTKGTVGQIQSGGHPVHPTLSPAISTVVQPDNYLLGMRGRGWRHCATLPLFNPIHG